MVPKVFRPRAAGRAGFTLIELLVVISIMSLLIGLIVSASMRFRETAAAEADKTQIKQRQLKLYDDYSAVLQKCHQQPIPDEIVAFCEGNVDRARAVHTAATLRAHFPETFVEAANDFTINGYKYEKKSTFKAVVRVTGATADEEAAVLLYLILTERSVGGTGGSPDNVAAGEKRTVKFGVKDFEMFIDRRGTPLTYRRWLRSAELDAAPYSHLAPGSTIDPLDPKNLVAGWTGAVGTANRTYLNKTTATSPNLGFGDPPTGTARRNRRPSVISFGKNKVYDNFAAGSDDLIGYQFDRQGK